MVRHAEKQLNGGNNPFLTAQGEKRAMDLNKILSKKRIEQIYSTNTLRTIATATPLANNKHIKVQIYNGSKPDSLYTQIKIMNYNTLIIGHSNTVPKLVNIISETVYLKTDLGDEEYDKLFKIKIFKSKNSKVKTIKF